MLTLYVFVYLHRPNPQYRYSQKLRNKLLETYGLLETFLTPVR